MTKPPSSEDPGKGSIENKKIGFEGIFRREVNKIVRGRLRHWRPESWEDDISKNTLDFRSFDNRPAIAEDPEQLRPFLHLIPNADEQEIMDKARRDQFPIPSADDREGYAPDSDARYWISGYRDYSLMMDVARKQDLEITSFLDFGCATGRVIRHVAAQSEIPVIWGTDINARHIRWLSEFMPRRVRPLANHCLPTLPIADHSVDWISAFSVFTHIDTFESCWLAELSRILSPRGIAYLTLHNEATWEAIRSERDNENNRLICGMKRADPDLNDKLSKPLPSGRQVFRHTPTGPYRAQVVHSNDYVEKVWGRYFELLEIRDCYHARQSVAILKKI